MKIRTDFVTNSSSSSYVVVVDKEYMDKVKSKLSKYHRAVFDALISKVGGGLTKCFDRDVYVISWMEGNNSTLEYLGVEDDRSDDEIDNDDGFEPALMTILKDESKFFTHSRNC